jgi:hypothetical protein
VKKLYTFLFLVFQFFTVNSQTLNDFRSNGSGLWSAVGSWQRFDGTNWVAATAVPSAATANLISIRSPHIIQVNAAVTLDQLVIDAGATLNWTAAAITIANGTGTDFLVNGTLIDNSTTSAVFNTGTRWEMGINGTYVKCRSNSAAVWRDNYNNGMSTIPATSNWIIRKNSTTNPTFTTVAGSFYGNFIVENLTATAWNMATASTFSGNSDFPRIKGNFDIGGSGSTAAISFLNEHTNANPTLVMGDLIIRSGNTYRNFGTGTEIQGNLNIGGNLTYDANDGRLLLFSGLASQQISGTGSLSVYELRINKSSGNLTLNRPLTVDFSLVLTNGKIISSATNLVTIEANATVTLTSPSTNNSFISGPLRKINTSNGFSFPVGKGNNYQPLSVNAHASGSNTTIYTENFNSGAAGWILNVVTGTEGADPNFFLIDDNEGGVLPSGCGVANNGNPTLHITSVFNPAGGAAYDAGGLCGLLFCPQANRRAESPIVNCSGRNNIAVSFNYIEGGQTTFDNASLWYFDGLSWTLLDDMPKTATGCGGQGIWTSRQVLLPASANNNPNVRVGFLWVNNDDGVGTDPSFAVDDVSLLEVTPVDVFTCEYFPANAVTTFGTNKDATIEQVVTNEYWILDRDGAAVDKHVTLSWDQNSSIVSNSGTKVIRWDGSAWRDHGNGGTSGIPAVDPGCGVQAVCGTVTSNVVVNSFSPFTFGTVLLLPITLNYFEATKLSNVAKLYWISASEENSSHFEIERSTDALSFTKIGKVNAVGNSNRTVDYQYIDNSPLSGLNYYRLKAFDQNGTFFYSEIKALEFDEFTEVRITPNPVSELINVQFDKLRSDVIVDIFSINGKNVFSGIYNAYSCDIDMSNQAAGFYVLRIMIGGAVAKTIKFEKI